MACTSASNIVLEPAFASWGKKNKDCITPVADVADSLNSTSFHFSSPTVSYYVWYSTGAGVDPAPAGRTAIPVVINTGDTAAAVLSATTSAIETANAAWATVSSDGLSFELESRTMGVLLSATVDVDSLFTFEELKAGLGGLLGRTAGAIEISIDSTSFEVKADQSGENLLDEIKTGSVLTCSMELLEMTAARWSEVVGGGLGDNHTPSAGTEFVGFGTSKDYVSMKSLAGELELKPVNATDDSRNFTFWLSLPKPSSYNFSGTDLQKMALEFSAYEDITKNKKVSFGGFGDNKQDMR